MTYLYTKDVGITYSINGSTVVFNVLECMHMIVAYAILNLELTDPDPALHLVVQ